MIYLRLWLRGCGHCIAPVYTSHLPWWELACVIGSQFELCQHKPQHSTGMCQCVPAPGWVRKFARWGSSASALAARGLLQVVPSVPPAAPADGQTSCGSPWNVKHHHSDGVYPILTSLREICSKILVSPAAWFYSRNDPNIDIWTVHYLCTIRYTAHGIFPHLSI